MNQRIESIFLVQWHALYSCKAQTNAYLITRNFFIVLRGFFPNKFAEKIIIFNEFFISLHASHSLPRYALCCLVSDFLLRILNSGVEVTLLQQLGWINLCELAFYIYIYIYFFFYHNRFFCNLLHILLIVGLTCHRFRPFTVASCSRDSTVRIWSLSHLACSLQIDVLAKKPLEEIVTPNTGMISAQISEILCV